MDKLIELGFEQAAVVTLAGSAYADGIQIEIGKYSEAGNILYAFVFHSAEAEDGVPERSEVRYIGHTRKTFKNRMYGYQNGGGQAVNNRMNREMQQHLRAGGAVDVLVLPDRHGLYMHGIHIDVAAGLEYALIDYYCSFNNENGHQPLVNIAGNSRRKADQTRPVGDESEEIKQELEAEDAEYEPPPANRGGNRQPHGGGVGAECEDCTFSFRLTERTYWPHPVFNVPVACQVCFGVHGDVVRVRLEGNNAADLQAVINRTANVNESPRIYFGGENNAAYTDWKRANHRVGDMVTVHVTGRNQITMR